MSVRSITLVTLLAVGVLGYIAWTRNTSGVAQPQGPGASPAELPSAEPGASIAMTTGGAATDDHEPPVLRDSVGMPRVHEPDVHSGGDPGLAWDLPKRWTDRGPGSMRLATYAIPAAKGSDEAQCAVYYFGPGQGGPVEANLDRWRGEFKNAKEDAPKNFNAKGARVTRIAIRGTYLAHAGMMSEAQPVESPNWALLGGIAEGPEGSVFFKLTGPEATVKTASKEFDAMLRSIRKK